MNAQPRIELSPLTGTMAGVKLSFPRKQVDGVALSIARVHYADEEDWWGANPRKKYSLPTQDSIIREFMFTLNRRTFQPASSKDDVQSYARNFRVFGDRDLPPESSRWLEFIFSPLLYSEGAGQLKQFYEKQMSLSRGLIGPFFPRPDAFGLRQISSDREGGPFQKTGDVYDTWYFDDKSWRTLISCMRHSDSKTPLKLSCVHYFVVPELKAIAYGRYMTITDVSDWKRIESEFRKLALSCLVREPAQ